MDSNKIKNAFESIAADENLADRVIASANSPTRHKRSGHARPLYAVALICLVGILATGGAAYAIVQSDFFASAWGNHGNGDQVTWSNEMTDGSSSRHHREFGDGSAPWELESAVQKVDVSTQGNGYTLKIHEMAIDRNGCGAATFTLSNPNGVAYYKPAAETGELVLNGATGKQTLNGISMLFGDDFADTRCTFEKKSSNATSIQGTIYFACFDQARDPQRKITWQLCWNDRADGTGEAHQASTPAFHANSFVEHLSLRSGGESVEISPFAIQIHIDDLGKNAVTDKLVVTFKDGTRQTIEEDAAGIYSSYLSLHRDNGTSVYIVTKMIDIDQVESVTLEGTRYGAGGDSESADHFSVTYRQS